MSGTGQYFGDLKLYEGQILSMNTPHTKLPNVVFVAMKNTLSWQQMSISVSQLSGGVEGPDLVKT